MKADPGLERLAQEVWQAAETARLTVSETDTATVRTIAGSLWLKLKAVQAELDLARDTLRLL